MTTPMETFAHAENVFLLMSILAQIEVFAEYPEPEEWQTDLYFAAMVRIGLPYEPDAWVGGELSPARRKALSRALRELEELGLVDRVTEPYRDRVRHVRLTAGGLLAALRLVGDDANPDAIVEALLRTEWGAWLPDALDSDDGRADPLAE